MPAGDLYELRDFQVADSNEILNVYWFQQTGGTGDATDLATAFADQWLPDILGIQSGTCEHVHAVVVNHDDGGDFADFSYASNSGARGGNAGPNFTSYAFILRRSTRLVRNGWKRYGPPAEGDIIGNAASGSPILTALAALAGTLSAPLVDGPNVYSMRIVHKDAGGALTPYPVATVDYVRVTTQTTRRKGRGA